LKKIERQIEKTKIYAPADGLVVHATSTKIGGFRRGVEPLQEGQAVTERQELIHLPTTTAAKVEVSIHEASLDKVSIGFPVEVTVDALPGKIFYGRVANIAPLPDARSAWLNPDLKVYDTEIYLENNSDALRTGMSCKAEIIVEQHKQATYIPVQAVLRIGGQPTVFMVTGEELVPRKIRIGFDNDRMVRIIDGIEAGEVVSLTPPLAAAAVEPAPYSDKITRDIISPKTAQHPAPEETSREALKGQAAMPVQQSELEGHQQTARGGNNLAAEQREKRRQLFERLSSEDKERFRNMTSEEKRGFMRQIIKQQKQTGDTK
jgi:hypothetical protein